MTMKGWPFALVCLLGGGGAIVGTTNPTLAQVTADPSIGTVVTPNGSIYLITGGTTVGNRNLFHSFNRFDVPTAGAAAFLNTPNIANIFARVTGGTRSDIQGLIYAQGTANLFLMNPSGILFGSGAQLNIGGSFVATTANAIQFGDRGFFNALVPNAPSSLLTVNPSAFLFNQANAAPIQSNSIAVAGQSSTAGTVRGLKVPDGHSLLLLGGDVTIDGGGLAAGGGGGLIAFGGRVELGGVAGVGTIGLTENGNNLQLNFPTDVPRANASITNSSRIDVLSGGGGDIAIHAQNVDISRRVGIFAGIGQGLGSISSKAGDIIIDAEGVVTISDLSIIGNAVTGIGSGGNINISGQTVKIINGSQASTLSVGLGDAGNVTIRADDTISISASGILAAIASAESIGYPGLSGNGNGGDVYLRARGIFLSDGALIATNNFKAIGNAGNIRVDASNSFFMTNGAGLQTLTNGIGDAGNLIIQAGNTISLTNGAQLNATTTGQGNAGSVTINAKNAVSFDGVGSNGSSSGAFSDVEKGAEGTGGDVIITTGSLSVTNGASLNASTLGEGDAGNVRLIVIGTATFDGVTPDSRFGSGASSTVNQGAIGHGGNVELSAGSLSVTNGASLNASTFGQGDAGNVKLTVIGTATFDGVTPDGLHGSGASSTVNQGAMGHGGNVELSAGSLSVTNGANLNASTYGKGDAGNVKLTVIGTATFDGVTPDGLHGSGASSTVNQGAMGHGGNVELSAGSLSVTNGANLNASTYGKGDAGNVKLTVIGTATFDGVTPDGRFGSGAFSIVNQSATGQGGTVELSAGSLSVTNGAALTASTFGQGDAGNVKIAVIGTATFDGVTPDGRFGSGASSTVNESATGQGGNVELSAGDLSVTNGAMLTASSFGQGGAGNIVLRVHDRLRMENGTIATASQFTSGGSIYIAAQSILMSGNSNIQTNVFNGVGNGGSITLTADSIIAFGDSNILAFARQGNGGNITLNTRAFFGQNYSPDNPLPFIGNGLVDINASGIVSGIIILPDTTFIQNSLTQLPQTLTDATHLLANSCIVRRGQQSGSFFITGSGALPDRPDDPSVSTFPTGEVRSIEGDREQGTGNREQSTTQNLELKTQNSSDRPWKIGDPIVEPQGVYQLSDGELVMSRECP
jgi:filamentous hemagglutinin family protein